MSSTAQFTPYGWVALAVFSGILAGFGQVLCKISGKAGMPPYVLIGIVGFMWLASSVAFIGTGGAWQKIGVSVMSFRGALALGLWVILAVVIAGFIFWVENLARFDAINKAPYITFVLMTIELSAGISALVCDLAVMWWKGTLPKVSMYEIGGALFAVAAIALFAVAPARASS